MSSLIFDSGDMQRLDREKQLTEEAPRQLPVEDKSVPGSILSMAEAEEPDDGDTMLKKVLEALKRRL